MRKEIHKVENKEEKIVVVTNLCDVKNFNISKKFGKKFRSEYLGIKDDPLIVYAGSLGKLIMQLI